jgi:hypothetical protein
MVNIDWFVNCCFKISMEGLKVAALLAPTLYQINPEALEYRIN